MTNLEAYNYFQDNKDNVVTPDFEGVQALTLKELMDLAWLVAQFGDINNINPDDL